MSQVRALLERVRRLEHRQAGPSPIEIWYGSFDAFEAETQKQIDAGKLCPLDVPIVLKSIRSWHNEGAWTLGHALRPYRSRR